MEHLSSPHGKKNMVLHYNKNMFLECVYLDYFLKLNKETSINK